jgi:adenine-specific DNA-methyltransferase
MVLEPSAGTGIFLDNIEEIKGIEIDTNLTHKKITHMDFFDYSTSNKFNTIIGNPPYVRFQDIMKLTKMKLPKNRFDKRTNLYIFFIDKCLDHLKTYGELIFITPRDFLKSTHAMRLNERLYNEGTITDFVETGDSKIFGRYTPNCAIWRFEKNNFTHMTNGNKKFLLENGHIVFSTKQYAIKLSDLFSVKVGGVSGLDRIFVNSKYGNKDFVCSETKKTGKTRRMIFNKKCDYLYSHKQELLDRRIKHFDEHNWWEWGRSHHIKQGSRIYVNTKTRDPKPFFISDVVDYDGSVLALFPKVRISLNKACKMLNSINWGDRGFICDGRFIFSQKSLEGALLPNTFKTLQ